MMKRTHARATLVLTVAAMAALVALTPTAAAEDVDIDVSPTTFKLASQSKVVVHAAIAYELVDPDSVELYLGEYGDDCGEDGCQLWWIATWKTDADDWGNLVAIFEMEDIKEEYLTEEPVPTADERKTDDHYATLVLKADNATDSSTRYWGTQHVIVIDEEGGRPSGSKSSRPQNDKRK